LINTENENMKLQTINNETNNFVTDNCRRYQLDRRMTKLTFVERFLQRGARTEHRRISDRNNFNYLDRHEPHLLLFSVIIIACSLIDSLLTVEILATGGVELNYFADQLIGLGLYGFIFSKFLITAMGIIVLVLHKHYFIIFGIQIRHTIYALMIFYTSLIAYETIIIILH